MFNDFLTKKLKEDEEVILVLHKHWASFLKQMVIALFVLVPPFFFIVFFFSAWWLMIVFFVWISVGFGFGLYQWFVWYFDTFIVTNRRVICINQKSLFSRTVAEANLANIQDITYEIKGILASILSFGALKIQTAGSTNSIKIENLANPSEVQEIILENQEKVKKSVSAEDLIKLIKNAEENEEKKK